MPSLLSAKYKSRTGVLVLKLLLIVDSLDLKSAMRLGFVGHGLKHCTDIHPDLGPINKTSPPQKVWLMSNKDCQPVHTKVSRIFSALPSCASLFTPVFS